MPRLYSSTPHKLVDQLLQGRQLLLVHQVEVLQGKAKCMDAHYMQDTGASSVCMRYAVCCAAWPHQTACMHVILKHHPSTHYREEDEVLEAGVQVGLLAQPAHLLKVRVVDVRIHAEQALEHSFGHVKEVGRKGLPELLRKDVGVINLRVI